MSSETSLIARRVYRTKFGGRRENRKGQLVRTQEPDLSEVLRRLFEIHGNQPYAGEPVTQLEHALQCAALAQSESASPALVTAALLHDIGHILDPNDAASASIGVDAHHEDSGEKFLARYFGHDVSEPVRLHVQAKAYLCLKEPEYISRLSAVSRRSLELQGGTMRASEAKAFIAQPYAQEAIRLRKWDDLSKEPRRVTPGLDHFLLIAKGVAS